LGRDQLTSTNFTQTGPDVSSTTQKGQHEPGAHSSRANQYRPEIDGLRAFAVIAVIANHMNPHILPSGYLGVDIFFVISGFVITASLLASSHTNLRLFLTNFYSRRARRLLPALLVFILITSLLICLVNPTPADTLLTGMSALFGGSNLYLMQRSADYFAPSTQLNAFTHTWSLGVEEQFYFFYPLLFWLASSRRLRWRSWIGLTLPIPVAVTAMTASKIMTGSYFSMIPGGLFTLIPYLPYLFLVFSLPLLALLKPFASKEKNLILCLVLISCLSLASFCFQYDHRFAAAYFLMPSRFWELAAGCLVFLLLKKNQTRQPLPSWAGLATLALISMILFLPQEMGKIATLLIVPLTAVGLASFANSKLVYHWLTRPLSLTIGRLSYSLYLWHWGILCLSRWTIGIHWWSAPALLALMLLTSAASYRWLEQPYRNSTWLRIGRRTFWAGAASLAASLVAMQGMRSSATTLSLDHHFLSDAAARREKVAQKIGKTFNRLTNHFDAKIFIQNLTHDAHGAPLIRPRFYVFGDSHSEHYVDALRRKLPGYGVGVGSTGWRCGYISPRDISPLTKQWMEGCERYKATIDTFLSEQLRPGDFVLVAHRWIEKKEARHQLEALDHLASIAAKQRGHLLAIDDVPELNVDDPLLCEKRPWRPFPLAGCFRSRRDVDKDQAPFDWMMHTLEADHPEFHYVQLRDLYCQGSVCGPYRDELSLYKDNNHLTPEASLLGAARVAAAVRSIAPADQAPAPHENAPTRHPGAAATIRSSTWINPH